MRYTNNINTILSIQFGFDILNPLATIDKKTKTADNNINKSFIKGKRGKIALMYI